MKTARMLTSLILMLAVAWFAHAEQNQTMNYKISGDYFEGCSCQISCGCDFGADSTGVMGCQASLVFHITHGSYGEVKLDGLTMVGMLLKPERNVASAIGKMEGGLYIDEKANEAQRKALVTIMQDQFGAWFGKLSGPKYVPIMVHKQTADAEGLADEYSVEIPDILTLKTTALKNEMGNRFGRTNVMPSIPVQYQGKAVTHTYNDWMTKWDFTGKNGFYGPFEFASQSTM